MHMSECVGCDTFPCVDVKHDRYILPDIEIIPEKITLILISEAAPDNSNDYYYAGGLTSLNIPLCKPSTRQE